MPLRVTVVVLAGLGAYALAWVTLIVLLAGAALLGLEREARVRLERAHGLFDRLGAMPDYDDHLVHARAPSRPYGVGHERSAADLVQDLGPAALEAGALSRSEDDDGAGCHGLGLTPPQRAVKRIACDAGHPDRH